MSRSMDDWNAELEARRRRALEMGGPDKVARQQARGRMTARERVVALVDPDSFFEIGLLAHSDMPEVEEKTPADGKVVGFAKIDGRPVAVKASDATILAGASGRVGSKKMSMLTEFALKKGLPLVILDEGGGVRVPDILGSDGIVSTASAPGDMAPRDRRVPMVTAILGDGFGETAWDAGYSDFVVQLKGSAMAVAGPRAIEVATSEQSTEEELGGWALHARVTGLVDMACEDEAQCLAAIRRFLSYLPSNSEQLPPRSGGDPEAAAR